MRRPREIAIAVTLCLSSLVSAGQDRPAATRAELAPGIFLFTTAGYGDVGLDGNSIAVTSRDGVLVFDTNGTPGAAADVLAQIRALTVQPVRWIVSSHWHWDHWYGTHTYQQAFPDVRVVSHEKNRQLMMGAALEFNRPFLEQQLPAYLQNIEKRAVDRPDLGPLLEADKAFLAQKKNVQLVFPNVTFTDRLGIELGERHIEVLNYGRGVTPGDTFVYLPAEKILLLGDLIVNPITFALSGYPTEWLRVLEKVDALDATTIVTGHGPPLHDKTLLHATMAVFRVLLREGKAAKAKGLDPDQAKEAIFPGLHELMVTITGDRPPMNDAFKSQLVDWYLHRVYEELDGPLSDAISRIPAS
ncbi:MAG TPA: MBL fold metallo-hydrolase [Vicinamibacterales bacterium]|nr:MBL fold metallo-hydrolase [Vicinamibacterales bacterium]